MNDNLKAYARHKITGKIIPLGEDNSPNLPKEYSSSNFTEWHEIIQIARELVDLFGFIFKVRVPKFIIIDGEIHYLATSWQKNDKIRVGYINFQGDFDFSFEDKSEKGAKKLLKNYLEENQII